MLVQREPCQVNFWWHIAEAKLLRMLPNQAYKPNGYLFGW